MMFPPKFWRYFVALWITVGGFLGVAIWLDNHRDLFETQPPVSVKALPEKILIDRGQELLLLGNCMACHTERGQAAGAGGALSKHPLARFTPATSHPMRSMAWAPGMPMIFGAHCTMVNPKTVVC